MMFKEQQFRHNILETGGVGKYVRKSDSWVPGRKEKDGRNRNKQNKTKSGSFQLV